MTHTLESIRKLRDEGMKEEWGVPIESLPEEFQDDVEIYLIGELDKDGGLLTSHDGIGYSVKDGKVFQHPPTIFPSWEMIDFLLKRVEQLERELDDCDEEEKPLD